MDLQTIMAKYNPGAMPLENTDYNLMVKFGVVIPKTNNNRFEITEQTVRPIHIKLIPSMTNKKAISVTVVETKGKMVIAKGPKGSALLELCGKRNHVGVKEVDF